MRFDLHVHTTFSACSRLTLGQIWQHARSRGLDGVCITDHDTMAASDLLLEGIQPNGLCVIFGMEYATSEGDFLLFGPFEALAKGLSAPLLLREVEASGGIAIAAHPFREGRATNQQLIATGHCTIVEGINGRNRLHENLLVNHWQDLYGIRPVGGSDAHSLDELGRVATSFHAPIRNRGEFVAALKAGAYTPVTATLPMAATAPAAHAFSAHPAFAFSS